jgi:hypothetical protein
MRTPDLNKALASLSSVLAEKTHLAEQERHAIEKTNRALLRIGYQITSITGQAKRPGRPRGSRNQKTKLTMHETGTNGIGKIQRRGPGRPRLRQAA